MGDRLDVPREPPTRRERTLEDASWALNMAVDWEMECVGGNRLENVPASIRRPDPHAAPSAGAYTLALSPHR